MENVIVIIVLAVTIGLAAGYIYKAKKSGKKCIGCPDSGCSCKGGKSSCGGGCGCCGNHDE